MGYLTAEQRAEVKRVRALGWVLPFTIEHVFASPLQDDYYEDDPDEVDVSYLRSGDFTYRAEETKQGTPGGYAVQTVAAIATDEDYLPLFAFSGARVVIEGVRMAITSFTTYEDFGEIVVFVKRIENPT